MQSRSVEITFRPLRVAWLVKPDDRHDLEAAIRYSCCFVGGRYSPILPIEPTGLAETLAKHFAIDAVIPISESLSKNELRSRFSWLPDPFYGGGAFTARWGGAKAPRLLDVRHTLRWLDESVTRRSWARRQLIQPSWEKDDRLSLVLLATFGGYPDTEDTWIDYAAEVQYFGSRRGLNVKPNEPIPRLSSSRTTPVGLTVVSLRSQGHYDPRRGFFIGDPTSVSHLNAFWNLRAAGNRVCFLPVTTDRLRVDSLIENLVQDISAESRHLPETIWCYDDPKAFIDEAVPSLPFERFELVDLNDTEWSVGAPRRVSYQPYTTFGIVDHSSERPRITIPLNQKPFTPHRALSDEHLAVNVHVYARRETSIFSPPLVPELNEFYGRNLHYEYNKVRCDSDGLAYIVDVADSEITLRGLNAKEILHHLLKKLGVDVTQTTAGLVLGRLLEQVGGPQGCRIFKLPGLRALLKQYAPEKTFRYFEATNVIKQGIEAHANLVIKARDYRKDLSAKEVFEFLQEKQLVRTGLVLRCPNCALEFWVGIDEVRSKCHCSYCDHVFLCDHQLRDGGWHYRKNGILGRNDNQLGAIPTALLIQQLDTNMTVDTILGSVGGLKFVGDVFGENGREFDLVGLASGPRNEALAYVAECKDDKGRITDTDLESLAWASHSFERAGIKCFSILARTSTFSEDEIALCREASLNRKISLIMLDPSDLEPYHIGDGVRSSVEYQPSNSFSSLAQNTTVRYRLKAGVH